MNDKRTVALRDVTLREGLDTPGVSFSAEQRARIALALQDLGLAELELVAPSRVFTDLAIVRHLKSMGLRLTTSGLIYSYPKQCADEIHESQHVLDRFDLLMPLSPKRPPIEPAEKKHSLLEAAQQAARAHCTFGVGFPHAFHTDASFLCELAQEAVREGASRITIYDTNGSSDPASVQKLIGELKTSLSVELFFHAHNDLGLATANSLAAVSAGADGLDVTVNGLGDRAGNAALEQVVAALYVSGRTIPFVLKQLRRLCQLVSEESGVSISKLAPIVGEFVYCHRSPSHLSMPALFEAIEPELFGSKRKITEN